MRIHFGNIPEIKDFQPEAEGLHNIRGPKASLSIVIAGLAGFFLLVCPLMMMCLGLSQFAIPNPEATPGSPHPAPWEAVVLALLLYIPLHEMLHLIGHPQQGFSDQSVLVLWPSKLRFGAYYEGCMSRTRWLIMRLLPFLILSITPAAFWAIFQYVLLSNFVKTFIEVVVIVNGVGSGADIMAALLVLFQVPSSARMCFRGGRAFWKPTSFSPPILP